MTPLAVTVNGVEHASEVEPRTLLVDYLRDELGLTGTKIGCDTYASADYRCHLAGVLAGRALARASERAG